MRKLGQIMMILLGILFVLPSCNDDDDDSYYLEVDEEWQALNTSVFNLRVEDDSVEYIYSESGNGRILYKVLKEGEGTETIYYTSNVNCYYKGCFITDDDGNLVENRDSVLTQGKVFDSCIRGEDDAFNTDVSDVIDGWSTALQHMHVGDIWEVWVPYSLGYGTTGTITSDGDTIKPYTTLVFQIEVKSIEEQ